MDTAILIFLGIAMAILVLAFLLPKWFRKSIERDRKFYDRNGDPRDASGNATWIGVRNSGDGDDL